MEKGDVGWKKSFSDEDRKAFGVSFGNDERQDIEANDRKSKHVLLKRKSTFQIDPLSFSIFSFSRVQKIFMRFTYVQMPYLKLQIFRPTARANLIEYKFFGPLLSAI